MTFDCIDAILIYLIYLYEELLYNNNRIMIYVLISLTEFILLYYIVDLMHSYMKGYGISLKYALLQLSVLGQHFSCSSSWLE